MPDDSPLAGKSTHSVTDALDQYQQQDPDAAGDLVRLLEEKLQLISRLDRFVQRHLPSILRPRVDTEALVYEALGDFLMGVRENRFPDLDSRENVRKILYRRLKHRLGQVNRDNLQAGIRDARNEVPIEPLLKGLVADPEPDESEDAGLERLDRSRKILRHVDPIAMSILDDLLAGRTVAKIAQSRRLGVGNVRNIIARMIEALPRGDWNDPDQETP
jgi:ECF sigma factor